MAVWGASATDVWVAGRGGLILHGAGDGTWTPEQSGTTDDLFALTGVGSDVYAVGDHGTILHRASGTWSADSSGTTNALWSIWGSSQDGLFAVGEAGTILHR
jgi:hypothetical protein